MSAVALDDVKLHLNITDSTNDSELAMMVEAAEAVLAKSVGSLEVEDPQTSRVTGSDCLVLPTAPILSVSVVTQVDLASTTILDSSTYDLDGDSGLVRFTDGRNRPLTYTVTYVAGREFIPADLELAVKEMTRHLWFSQRGPRRPGSPQVSDGPQPGYLLPYLVEQLIEPYRLVGVGAA